MGGLSLVKSSELRNMKSPDWLIDTILPQQSTAMVYGLEGSHKSFLTLEMMFCVTTGTPFFGHKVVKKKGLYSASEGGPPLGKRLKAWEEARGIQVDDNHLSWFMEESIMLDEPKGIERVLPDLQRGGFEFIIHDTLRTSSAGDELSPEVMGAITRSMRLIQRECNATVLVVHHSPKGNPEGYSGSGVLGSNLSTSMNVIFDKGSGNTYLKSKKAKDAEKFDTLTFEHRKVGESLVMELRKTGKKEARNELSENAQYILDNCENSIERGVLRQKIVDTEGKMSTRTFDRRVLELQNSQHIAVNDGTITRL